LYLFEQIYLAIGEVAQFSSRDKTLNVGTNQEEDIRNFLIILREALREVRII
jgi:hypothetical protein